MSSTTTPSRQQNRRDETRHRAATRRRTWSPLGNPASMSIVRRTSRRHKTTNRIGMRQRTSSRIRLELARPHEAPSATRSHHAPTGVKRSSRSWPGREDVRVAGKVRSSSRCDHGAGRSLRPDWWPRGEQPRQERPNGQETLPTASIEHSRASTSSPGGPIVRRVQRGCGWSFWSTSVPKASKGRADDPNPRRTPECTMLRRKDGAGLGVSDSSAGNRAHGAKVRPLFANRPSQGNRSRGSAMLVPVARTRSIER